MKWVHAAHAMHLLQRNVIGHILALARVRICNQRDIYHINRSGFVHQQFDIGFLDGILVWNQDLKFFAQMVSSVSYCQQ